VCCPLHRSVCAPPCSVLICLYINIADHTCVSQASLISMRLTSWTGWLCMRSTSGAVQLCCTAALHCTVYCNVMHCIVLYCKAHQHTHRCRSKPPGHVTGLAAAPCVAMCCQCMPSVAAPWDSTRSILLRGCLLTWGCRELERLEREEREKEKEERRRQERQHRCAAAVCVSAPCSRVACRYFAAGLATSVAWLYCLIVLLPIRAVPAGTLSVRCWPSTERRGSSMRTRAGRWEREGGGWEAVCICLIPHMHAPAS
jgi:hypothetical protein